MKPLTNEQIWGVPEEQLPPVEIKDYFDYGSASKEDARKAESVEDFIYESGYCLQLVDMGSYDGVTLSLEHNQYDKATILLPPQQTERLARWLMKTMGQVIPHLPNKLGPVLSRLAKSKTNQVTLERGDRVALKEALLIMRIFGRGQRQKAGAERELMEEVRNQSEIKN